MTYMLNHNEGVLKGAYGEKKSPVEQKDKNPLEFDFKCEYESVAYRSFGPSTFEARTLTALASFSTKQRRRLASSKLGS